jgi:hypothetical protein
VASERGEGRGESEWSQEEEEEEEEAEREDEREATLAGEDHRQKRGEEACVYGCGVCVSGLGPSFTHTLAVAVFVAANAKAEALGVNFGTGSFLCTNIVKAWVSISPPHGRSNCAATVPVATLYDITPVMSTSYATDPYRERERERERERKKEIGEGKAISVTCVCGGGNGDKRSDWCCIPCGCHTPWRGGGVGMCR